MNSLLVAHPEIREEIWYKWENVTNRSLPTLEMFGTALKLKISLNGTGLFLTLILDSNSSFLHQKLSRKDSKSSGEGHY